MFAFDSSLNDPDFFCDALIRLTCLGFIYPSITCLALPAEFYLLKPLLELI